MRRLPLRAARVWLENWGAWNRDVAACYPQEYVVASAEGAYRCPQRNHHDTAPAYRPDPVWIVPATLLEDLMQEWKHDGHRERLAAKVEYVTHPAHIIRLRCLEHAKWTEMRASAAHMAPATYWEALNAVHDRLTADLWPFRHEFPRALAAKE